MACCHNITETCEDLCDREAEAAAREFESYPLGHIKYITELFFGPKFIVNPEQFKKQVREYLVNRQPCFKGNNALKICDCTVPCCCEEVENGCDDPDQCNTYNVGWNYVALAKAAEFAASLAYIPVKITDPQDGDVLVYDSTALADNQPCDPCEDQVVGAWVNGVSDSRRMITRSNILSDSLDPTVPQVVGDNYDAPLCVGDAQIVRWWVSATDDGINGTVEIALSVDGAATGETITLSPVGVGQQILGGPLTSGYIVAGVGAHYFSWHNTGGGTATVGTIQDIEVTADVLCN